MGDEDVRFDLTPAARGHAAPSQYLAAEATIYIVAMDPAPGFIWRIGCDAYTFEAVFEPGAVRLRRNGHEAQVAVPIGPGQRLRRLIMAFVWSPVLLGVTVNYAIERPNGVGGTEVTESEALNCEVVTPSAFPPNRLISWARRQSLVPIARYASEAEFRETVLTLLTSLQDALDTHGAHGLLWDVAREGNTITSRTPKREVDCQLWVRTKLHDAAIAKSLEIAYEPAAGNGSLDALITGAVPGGLARACVEFKLAHSQELEHGVDVQLPEYMKLKSSDFGIYCVFYFRCDVFDVPPMSRTELELLLTMRNRKTATPPKIIVVDCGFRDSPSKM